MLFAGVSLSPSTSDLPGGAALQSIADGIASWALIGALVALLLGAMLWAIGSHTQNMHQSSQGRRAVMTSLVAAILIGAAPELINFFFNAGLAVLRWRTCCASSRRRRASLASVSPPSMIFSTR